MSKYNIDQVCFIGSYGIVLDARILSPDKLERVDCKSDFEPKTTKENTFIGFLFCVVCRSRLKGFFAGCGG